MVHRRHSQVSTQNFQPSSQQGPRHHAHAVNFTGLFERRESRAGRPPRIETERELDSLMEEERQLARRRQELEQLNAQQGRYLERRRQMVSELHEALGELERERIQWQREARILERVKASCERHLADLGKLSPGTEMEPQTEEGWRQLMQGLNRFEERLEAELGEGAGSVESVEPLGLGKVFLRSVYRGWARLWPYFVLGGIVVYLFLQRVE